MKPDCIMCVVSLLLVAGAVGAYSLRVICCEVRRWRRRQRVRYGKPGTTGSLADMTKTLEKRIVEAHNTPEQPPVWFRTRATVVGSPRPFYHCAAHGRVFAATGTCPECAVDFDDEQPTIPREHAQKENDDELVRIESHG